MKSSLGTTFVAFGAIGYLVSGFSGEAIGILMAAALAARLIPPFVPGDDRGMAWRIPNTHEPEPDDIAGVDDELARRFLDERARARALFRDGGIERCTICGAIKGERGRSTQFGNGTCRPGGHRYPSDA